MINLILNHLSKNNNRKLLYPNLFNLILWSLINKKSIKYKIISIQKESNSSNPKWKIPLNLLNQPLKNLHFLLIKPLFYFSQLLIDNSVHRIHYKYRALK